MGIFSWIMVGLIAGWLAERVLKAGVFGMIGDIVIGVIGGLLGGFLASFLFHAGDPMTGINLTSILIAFLGSVLLLGLVRMLAGKKALQH